MDHREYSESNSTAKLKIRSCELWCRGEKDTEKININGRANALLRGYTTEGVQNYDQNLSKKA